MEEATGKFVQHLIWNTLSKRYRPIILYGIEVLSYFKKLPSSEIAAVGDGFLRNGIG
jgi:hypothetical protein